MHDISLLKKFIAETYYSNIRPTMDVPTGQSATKWDANPDEPLYYHDPTSGEALQTDDEELWERSPLSDLQEPSVF
mgnify:CR=1 FL=1